MGQVSVLISYCNGALPTASIGETRKVKILLLRKIDMTDFETNLAQDLDRPWLVINTVDKKGGGNFIPARVVIEAYQETRSEGLVTSRNPLADLHYLTGGSMLAFEWMCQGMRTNAADRAALLNVYKAFDEENLESVGPMFLHYIVALVNGETDDFVRFCSTRQIGDKYLTPVLMHEQTEEDMALELS